MGTHWIMAVGLGVAVLAGAIAGAGAAVAKPVDFNQEVRPILSDNCFACHEPDEKQRKAKLRLDTEDGSRADLGKGVPAAAATSFSSARCR